MLHRPETAVVVGEPAVVDAEEQLARRGHRHAEAARRWGKAAPFADLRDQCARADAGQRRIAAPRAAIRRRQRRRRRLRRLNLSWTSPVLEMSAPVTLRTVEAGGSPASAAGTRRYRSPPVPPGLRRSSPTAIVRPRQHDAPRFRTTRVALADAGPQRDPQAAGAADIVELPSMVSPFSQPDRVAAVGRPPCASVGTAVDDRSHQ